MLGECDALNRALLLPYLEERSYAEIAHVLGISATNVATKISRLKVRLVHFADAERGTACREGVPASHWVCGSIVCCSITASSGRSVRWMGSISSRLSRTRGLLCGRAR